VLYPHTDERLGNCSFLNTCRNPRMCKHIHYEFDPEPDNPAGALALQRSAEVPSYLRALPEGQWIKCDIRNLDLSILGKFGVIMTDPPWEIHQDLPYGTLMDDELRGLNVGCLQDDGVIFMWVTGECTTGDGEHCSKGL
jgi:mRNA (2'-O-methyladenosine-N6-)-methyltransferase